MTTALLESPLSMLGEGRRFRPTAGAGITLEELLERTLRSARAGGMSECPVCHARMHAEGDSARCSGCGATLS
jgi:tRNA(Ile2) C34 agmatinyltransferase TiaS